METLIKVFFIGLIAGVFGTLVGGIIGVFFKTDNNKLISCVMEFSGGIMLSVVCFDLIPESQKNGSLTLMLLGLFTGLIITHLIYSMQTYLDKQKKLDNSLSATGKLIFIALALHNLPEGLAIGTSFAVSPKLGFSIFLVLIIHNIPEGMAMSVTSKAGGISNAKCILMTIVAGVPMAIGSLLGTYFGSISHDLISICLALAGGAMLYVVILNIIPQAKKINNSKGSSMACIIGIVAGLLLTI